MDKRQAGGLDTRKAAIGRGDRRLEAVGIGKRYVSHPARITHPQVSPVLETHSPAHQHGRRVTSRCQGIGAKGVPCRIEHPGERHSVNGGQGGAPLAIGFVKFIGFDVGIRGRGIDGETQLRNSIRRVNHHPPRPCRGQVGEAAVRDNDNHTTYGMGIHNSAIDSCHYCAVDFHHGIQAGHVMPSRDEQQAFARANLSRRCGHTSHLQRIFLFTNVKGNGCLATLRRFAVDALNSTPRHNRCLFH